MTNLYVQKRSGVGRPWHPIPTSSFFLVHNFGRIFAFPPPQGRKVQGTPIFAAVGLSLPGRSESPACMLKWGRGTWDPFSVNPPPLTAIVSIRCQWSTFLFLTITRVEVVARGIAILKCPPFGAGPHENQARNLRPSSLEPFEWFQGDCERSPLNFRRNSVRLHLDFMEGRKKATFVLRFSAWLATNHQ